MTCIVKRHLYWRGQAVVTWTQRRKERAMRGSRPRSLTGGWYVVGLLSFRLFVWQGLEERVLFWETRSCTRTATPTSHALFLSRSLSPAHVLFQAGECESGESTLMVCVEASNSFFQHFLSRKNTLTLALLDHPSPPSSARPRHTSSASMRVRSSSTQTNLYLSKLLTPINVKAQVKARTNVTRFCIFYSTRKKP